MRIGLMANVPDQPVLGRVEDPVQSNRQLDNAKTGAKMPTRHGNRVNHFGPQLVGELRKIALRQLTKIVWRPNAIE
jgi:hypothetical protein